MKNVLLIGLGRFGRHMAQKLSDLHHQVLVIDKDEHKVQEAMGYVTNAEIGDATDPALIDALGVSDFDYAIAFNTHSNDKAIIFHKITMHGFIDFHHSHIKIWRINDLYSLI